MSINSVFKNVPYIFGQSIQHALSQEVTHHEKRVYQYEVLPYGLNFEFEDTVWNIQVWNSFNHSCIRMSTEDTIQAWLFESNTKMSDQLRHCEMLASPTQTSATPFPDRFYAKASYPCESNPRFVTVMTKGRCLGQGPVPKVSQDVYKFATKWFEENNIKTFILPMPKPAQIKDSQYDFLLKTVDDTFFKTFFKYLAYVTAAYLIYRIISPLFQSKAPAISPPKAILVE